MKKSLIPIIFLLAVIRTGHHFLTLYASRSAVAVEQAPPPGPSGRVPSLIPSNLPPDTRPLTRPSVIYRDLTTIQARRPAALIDGRVYSVGDASPWGRVISVDAERVLATSIDGLITIYSVRRQADWAPPVPASPRDPAAPPVPVRDEKE